MRLQYHADIFYTCATCAHLCMQAFMHPHSAPPMDTQRNPYMQPSAGMRAFSWIVQFPKIRKVRIILSSHACIALYISVVYICCFFPCTYNRESSGPIRLDTSRSPSSSVGIILYADRTPSYPYARWNVTMETNHCQICLLHIMC